MNRNASGNIRNVLDRRRVLRGMLGMGGAVAIPLPALNIMLNGNGTALAATGEPLPVRYVTWFFGNGVLPATWHPIATGAGDDWALTPQLATLAKVKDSLIVVSGLQANWLGGQHGHPGGGSACVTGSECTGDSNGIPKGPSVDQEVADLIGTNTPFRSLEIGVSESNKFGDQVPSQRTTAHRRNGTHLFPDFDPRTVYKRIIGVAPTNPVDMKALAQTRGSAFDAVMEDASQLGKQLGKEDRLRLDGHLEGLRTLANRVAALPTAPAAVPKPAQPTLGPDTTEVVLPARNTVMTDLAMYALGTGQTNVLSFLFTLPGANGPSYRHLGPDMDAEFHNDICHGDPGTAGNQPRVLKGVVYSMSCLAEFLEKMRAVPDGSGTLLDHALVHVTSDMAWGKPHSVDDFPVLLAGRAGGRIRSNQHLRFPKGNLTSVLLTMANVMGLGLKQFGAGNGISTTVLPGIMV